MPGRARFLRVARALGIHALVERDRRDALVAFVTLFGIMAAHAVLETARDGLFLSRLPAEELPWAYIAIAALSLGIATATQRLRSTLPRRLTLAVSLVAGGVITASFHVLVEAPTRTSLLALYVWTGLLATIVVVEFWLLIAHVLDIGQAKRVFALVGAGGLAGAAAGAAAAGALLVVLPPASLLLVSGAILGVTAAAPPFFSAGRPPAVRTRQRQESSSLLTVLRNDPYLRRLLGVALAASMLLTGVDFVFKATAAVDLAPEQLAPFFARFYAVIGGVALLVQLVIAPRALRVLGVNGSLLLLPTLLLCGSAGFVLVGGLGAAILVRGADGALRHSLHRTGMEILYVPLLPSVRERYKAFVEAIGQRGGQGLASVLLLGALSVGARPAHVGLGLLSLAVLWLLATLGIRPHYVDLFRRNLREGALETHVEVPDLDLSALEALIAALGSENDHEVLASLDLLAAYGKSNLVPALILHHPSADVVLHAFSLLSGASRPDVDRLVPRLIRHDDERIRAAALRWSAARADGSLLESMAEDPSPLVRTTAVVELVRRGAIDEWKGGDLLRGIIDGGSAELRRALAIAARNLPVGRYAWALIRLAFVPEPGLSRDVVRSMAAAPDVEYVPTLVRLLSQRDCREDARAAIVGLGDAALGALEAALDDPALPRAVRRHLPRTISRFGGPESARIIERRLAVETDEVVSLKLARALGRLRAADPSIVVDRRELQSQARAVLERATTLLYWQVVTERVAREDPTARSPASEMLGALLADKESSALERVFRILKILDPSEQFESLLSGLRSDDARLRESGRELLSHVAPEPLRAGILAALGDGPPEERLREAALFHDPPGRARFDRAAQRLATAPDGARSEALVELRDVHVECLGAMLLDPSAALRGVASYRIAELGIDELEPELRAAQVTRAGALAALGDDAVDLIERASAEVSRAG